MKTLLQSHVPDKHKMVILSLFYHLLFLKSENKKIKHKVINIYFNAFLYVIYFC